MTSGYGGKAENESSSRSSRSHEGDSPPSEWGLSPYFHRVSLLCHSFRPPNEAVSVTRVHRES
jgi:hypothetical protein